MKEERGIKRQEEKRRGRKREQEGRARLTHSTLASTLIRSRNKRIRTSNKRPPCPPPPPTPPPTPSATSRSFAPRCLSHLPSTADRPFLPAPRSPCFNPLSRSIPRFYGTADNPRRRNVNPRTVFVPGTSEVDGSRGFAIFIGAVCGACSPPDIPEKFP